jgi:uncharacterized membrane protein
MTPLRFLGLYGSAMVTFLALDLLWLGIVARGFYANQLGHLMRPDVRWGAAFLFYAIYVLGIVVLAVLPALDAGSLARAAGLGALLGLVAYAAYDLTNMATLAGFPARMVVVDLIWGTVLTAAVASAAFAVGRWMGLG